MIEGGNNINLVREHQKYKGAGCIASLPAFLATVTTIFNRDT